jgi:hypothetical protein
MSPNSNYKGLITVIEDLYWAPRYPPGIIWRSTARAVSRWIEPEESSGKEKKEK